MGVSVFRILFNNKFTKPLFPKNKIYESETITAGTHKGMEERACKNFFPLKCLFEQKYAAGSPTHNDVHAEKKLCVIVKIKIRKSFWLSENIFFEG